MAAAAVTLAVGVVGAGEVPYWGDADLDVLGGVNQSVSVGRCGGVKAEAGRRAACAGMGWNVEAATVALGKAGVI